MRLFEVIQLLEYNTQVTLNNWGERIAQAAMFNETHLEDEWFYQEVQYPDDKINDEASLAKAVLNALEKMDPTKNKQYVMTLVRWYIGVIKADKKLQARWEDVTADDRNQFDLPYPPPEDYTDLNSSGYIDSLSDEDYESFQLEPQNLNTFKLEDADQIRTALENFERIKPQLQPNERDIGRYKSFYRFEDFVDSKMDPELKQNMKKELLDRSDVKVLYNGPMGTVSVPYSKNASCQLGKGTKWCTAASKNNMFRYYSERGDLMIYNEKPGNEKYQIHVTLNGIEIRDSRDRAVKLAKRKEFEQTHPVISKLIQKQKEKIIIQLRDTPFDPMEYQNWMGQIDTIIDFNAKHHGKPLRFIDEFWTEPDTSSGGLSPYIQKGNIPKQTLDQLMKYAVSRNQRWPEIEAMFMQMFNSAFGPESDNWNKHKPQMVMTSLDRMMTQLKPYIDKYGWPELEQYKSQLLAKIQKPVQEANSFAQSRANAISKGKALAGDYSTDNFADLGDLIKQKQKADAKTQSWRNLPISKDKKLTHRTHRPHRNDGSSDFAARNRSLYKGSSYSSKPLRVEPHSGSSPINTGVQELIAQGMSPSEIEDYLVFQKKIKRNKARQIIDKEYYKPASTPPRRDNLGDIRNLTRTQHKQKQQPVQKQDDEDK